MTRKLVALVGASLALFTVSSLFDPADARRGGGGGGGGYHAGARSFSGGGHHIGARTFSGGGHHFAARSIYRSGGPRLAYSGGGYVHRGHRHRHAHRFHGRRLVIAAPLVYGAYSYGDGCYWLWRNAQETGSGYWWNRYYACLDGYAY